MQRSKLWIWTFVPILGLLGARSSAQAQDAAALTVGNAAPVAAAQLHVKFAGVGAPMVVIVDPLGVAAPGCPPPTVPSNPPTITDTVVIDWGVACVPPGAKITFVVVAPNAAPGTLTIVDCFWTDTSGVPIGLCLDCGLAYLPPGPIGAFKLQYRYTPLGFVFYTLWRQFPGQPCWWRWCCNPWGWCCEVRVLYCPFTTRLFRLFEVPPWIPLTAFTKAGFLPPGYWWQRTTVPPPPHLRANGAWFNAPNPGDGLYYPGMFDLEVRYTDDGGQTFRPAADLTSTAYAVWNALQVTAPLDPNNIDPVGPPAPSGFVDTLQFVGPGFINAGQALQPLINEIDDVRALEPNPVLDQMRVDVEIIALSLVSIGNSYQSGSPGPVGIHQQLAGAMNNFALDLQQIGVQVGSARFQRTAETILSMNEGVNEAVTQLLLGLPTIESQDLFTWGMLSRFVDGWRHVASSAMPHIRVQLDLGDYVWFGSSSEGARVIVQDAASNKFLDVYNTPLSDQNTVDVVVFDPTAPLRLSVRLPTHLTRTIDVPFVADGMLIPAPPLIQGDVNGDNCVDAADVAQVTADIGAGGPAAGVVPSSDVNADGQVTIDDVNIVLANVGQCGELLPCPWSLDGNRVVDLTDLAILLSDFDCTGGGCAGDVDGDGDTDLTDLALLLTHFDEVCP